MIMLIFGGLPWQAYFQRVLSATDCKIRQTLFLTEKGILKSHTKLKKI